MELILDSHLLRHLENSHFAVIGWQEDFEVTSWSESAENLFGVPAGQALGAPWLDYVAEQDRPRILDAARALARGERTSAEVLVQTSTSTAGTLSCFWRGSAVPREDGSRSLLWLVERATHPAESAAASFFERAFRAGPAALLLCSPEDGRVLDVSEAFARMMGHAPATLIGGTFQDAGFLAAPGLMDLRNYAESDAEPFTTEVLFRTRDGRPRRGLAMAVRMDRAGVPRLLVLILDTTRRVRAEEALKASESRFRTLVEALPQAVVVAEENGAIAYGNGQWHEYVPEDVETMEEAIKRAVHPEDREAVYDVWVDRHGRRELPELQVRLLTEQGETCWHLLGFTLLRTSAIIGEDRWLCTFTDINREKETEAAHAFARQEAEAAAQAKSAFLANMSHEIRTPLTAILGFAQVLLEEAPEDQKWIAETIVEGGQRLTRTLEALLTLSKLEADQLTLEPEPLALHTELTLLADLYGPRAEAKGLELTYTAAPDATGDCAMVDPGAFTSVLQNLVSNAIKFTAEGRVDVHLRRVRRMGQPWLSVRVSDTGPGISEEFLPRLFEAFHQESSGYKREHEGFGLGLHIAHELVTRMGGQMDVDSKLGEGTTFTVRFPVHTPEPEGIAFV